MRCGLRRLAAKVQTTPKEYPLGSDVYIFRGRRGDLSKILWLMDDWVSGPIPGGRIALQFRGYPGRSGPHSLSSADRYAQKGPDVQLGPGL